MEFILFVPIIIYFIAEMCFLGFHFMNRSWYGDDRCNVELDDFRFSLCGLDGILCSTGFIENILERIITTIPMVLTAMLIDIMVLSLPAWAWIGVAVGGSLIVMPFAIRYVFDIRHDVDKLKG